MGEDLRGHLSVIVVVALLGLAAGGYAFVRVHDAVPTLDYNSFSTLTIAIPCIIMFICAFIMVMTAEAIGKQLYGAIVGICVIAGIISMIVVNVWTSDAAVVSALLANSASDTHIAPLISQPLLVIRDIAAFIVVPTVACILGALVGSRLHAMRTVKKR